MPYTVNLILFLLLSLLSQPLLAQSKLSANTTSVFRDIIYKTTTGGDSIGLDVFVPSGKKITTTPIVIHIHGGAWVRGDKNFEKQYYTRSLRDRLQKNGYAFISVNYRLLNGKTDLADQVSDVYDAVQWVKDHADQYHFDLNNVGVMGESAGAHLALLLAYSDIEKKDVNFKYIIDVFGPTDLNQLFRTNAGWFVSTVFKTFKPKLFQLRNNILTYMTSQDITKNKSKVIESAAFYSPIQYIDSSDKTPALLLHGDKDKIVAYKQSSNLKKKLNNTGVKNELITVKKGNHGFTTTSKSELDNLVNASYHFIKDNTSR